MELVKDFGKTWRGVLFALVIAVPAWLLGKRFEVVGGPVFAILLGMVLALLVPAEKGEPLAGGIKFTSKKVLQCAVILLGFGLNLAQIAQVGMTSLPIIVSTIATSLVVSFVLCRALNIPGKISTLIGVGSSICGGSAIAATAPVIEADDEEIAQAISVIFLFNMIAALVFPTLGGALGLTNEGFGLFAGTAVNDTSSVTAAAAAWDGMHPGANTLDSATIVKLTRTLAIIPITLALAFWQVRQTRRAGGEAKSTFSLRRAFPALHRLLRAGERRDHRLCAARSRNRPHQGALQVLHHHGYGGDRLQHQHRQARAHGRQADPHGPLLLGCHRVRESGDAARPRHLVGLLIGDSPQLTDGNLPVQAHSSLALGLPLSRRPSRTVAPFASVAMRCGALPRPLLPLVANGTMTLPVRSYASRKVSTMRGSTYHQMGNPTKTVS